jgi:predicted nucleotidyltransferase component of viral defense system
MGDEPSGRWYHEDVSRFRDALRFSEAESGFRTQLIEKDYYCSLVLHDLSELYQHGLVFKGGTCLSKVHAEFFRLSEDLDFSISLRSDATPSERRQASAPIKAYFDALPGRLAWVEEIGPLTASNRSRQYNGQLAYRSAVTGEREFIRLEVSLREEHHLDPGFLPARTLLRDPHSGRPALDPVSVRVLHIREAYAEKIRAALTRREPAIRDFFDIDHATRAVLFDTHDSELLRLVAAKLSVTGNQPVDLSPSRITTLQGQIETHLRPVLRTSDYDMFDLQRVIMMLVELVSRLEKN